MALPRPQLFFISGLGADHRAFKRIELGGYDQTHLPWLIPEKGETLETYARRMAEPVMKAEFPIVIGLSLGGMITSEMSTFVPNMQGILISSIKHPKEKPALLKTGKVFPIQGLITGGFMKRMSWVWPLTQKKARKEDIEFMMQMFRDQNSRFLRWATLAAPKWTPKGDLDRLTHIHGTADRMFPIKKIIDPIVVEGGTHLMVYTRGKEVTELLKKELTRIETELK